MQAQSLPLPAQHFWAPRQLSRIECERCKREVLFTSEAYERFVGGRLERLKQRLKCTSCGHRGASVVHSWYEKQPQMPVKR